MPHLVEKTYHGELKDHIFKGENEFVVHISTCKGKFQDEFSVLKPVAEKSEKFNMSLQQLKGSWREHPAENCEMLGTYCGCGTFGFLFLHAHEGHNPETKEETLENLSHAAMDLFAKLPKPCTIHSQPFSMQSTGGPSWREIRMAFQHAIADAPEVSWIFWKNSTAANLDDEENNPSFNLTFETKEKSDPSSCNRFKLSEGEVDEDGMLAEELKGFTSSDASGDTKDSNSDFNIVEDDRMISCCKNELYNVRNSMDLTKNHRKSHDGEDSSGHVRMMCTWLPIFKR